MSRRRPVTWKRGRNLGERRTFRDINSVGWVNEEINLGKLINVRDERNRVVFEFDQNGRFDAWSSLNTPTGSGSDNKAKLTCGHSYILSGAVQVRCKSNTKYERGSSSTAKYSILLGRIRVVCEFVEPTSPRRNSQSTRSCLNDLKTEIDSGRYFTTKVQNIKITSGEIYRYMGCEICFTGIPTPDEDSRFYCSQCLKRSGPKSRRMCTIIRSLMVRDPTNRLYGLVIYHHEIEKLLGVPLMKEICDSFTDWKARTEFQKLVGCTINANIVHQQPTRSTLRRFNWAKLIVKDIEVVAGLSNLGPISGPSSSSTVASGEAEIPEVDESDGDEDDANSFPQISNSFDGNYNEGNVGNVDDNSPRFEVDRVGAYPLTKSSTGFYGLVLIININSDTQQPLRNGSEHDIKILEEVFPKLGMKIFSGKAIENPGLAMFQQILLDFKAELTRDKHSCFFFVFMGHGAHCKVTLADASKINMYNDIMCKFSEEQFSHFTGKPKIFIFESCQVALANQNGFTVPTNAPMSDLLWITPVMPGQKSKRSPTNGCYFIQTLAKCLYVYRRYPLRDIVCKMSRMLANDRRRDNGFYAPTDSSRGFRQFLFNLD